MKKGGVILTILLIIIISGGTFLVGYLWANNFLFFTSPTQITPTLDGTIDKKEWARATHHNIAFYLDVDNSVDPLVSKNNVDGWNYMSIAEDENYYYVALDLCSDRTNNEIGEWISFFTANRMPQFLSSNLALHSLVDRGLEYVFYDVENNLVFPNDQFTGPGTNHYYEIPIVPETDLIYALYGNTSSSYLDFWRIGDSKNYTIESFLTDPPGSWMLGNYLDLQFGIDIDEKMPDIDTSTFMAAIADMDLSIRISANKTTNYVDHFFKAEDFYCSVYEHGPMPSDFEDPLFDSDYNNLNFNAGYYTTNMVDLDHAGINATDGMFYFTIHCWNEVNATHPTAYELYIDSMNLHFQTTNYYSTVGSTVSAANYDIAWAYGPSENCAEDHRMFEFRIAKSEFPNMAEDMIYLCVAGYGTMAMPGLNYWQYPQYGEYLTPLNQFVDSSFDFLAFDMSST
jgi:hypothetical protein